MNFYLDKFNIESFSDRNNVGIWIGKKNNARKIGAIGIKIKRWIAYHGFSINLKTNLKNYEKIIPCGIKNKKIENLKFLKKSNHHALKNRLINNFIKKFGT